MIGKIVFNSREPDLEALRRMMFERLRTDSHWKSLNALGIDYSGYVDFDGHSSQQQLADCILQVFWQLVTEGVLAPGMVANRRTVQAGHCLRFRPGTWFTLLGLRFGARFSQL